MPYAPLPEIAEALDDLERRLRAERHPERKRRLHMLVLFKEDPERTRLKVAEHLAVHRNTIRRWLTLYREGGLDGLLTMKPRGFAPGQRTVSESVCEALRERLDDPQGFSGYDEVQQWLQTEFGLQVPYKSVYNLVRYHLGAKLKVPRPEHPKKA